jgi:hypothetical protein
VLATGLVLGGVAVAKWNSITATCPGGTCSTEADRARMAPDQSTASTFATLSTIGVAAGGVTLAAGILLAIVAPGGAVVVAPVGGGGQASLLLSRF